MKRFLAIAVSALLLAGCSARRRAVVRLAEHLAIGAGSCAAITALDHGAHPRWAPCIATTALVAGFKEGSDANNGQDTRKEAIRHALMILAGGGATAALWH